jgi:hypothetical protein
MFLPPDPVSGLNLPLLSHMTHIEGRDRYAAAACPALSQFQLLITAFCAPWCKVYAMLVQQRFVLQPFVA